MKYSNTSTEDLIAQYIELVKAQAKRKGVPTDGPEFDDFLEKAWKADEEASGRDAN